MTLKNVVVLAAVEHYSSFDEIYFLNELQAKGYHVESWNLRNLVCPRVAKAESTEIINGRKFWFPNTLRSVYAQMRGFDSAATLYIITFPYTLKSLLVWALLESLGCRTAFFARGIVPDWTESEQGHGLLSRIRKRFVRFGVVGVLGVAIARVVLEACRRIFKFNRFDVIFAAGSESEAWARDHAKKVVSINYFDYDRYLDIRDKKGRLHTNPYILFLDEYLPYHPDFEILGIKTVDGDAYYAELNAFFSEVERRTNLDVVIAAHPKADYSENPFDGRPLFKGETAILMRDCEMAMAHMSTSICYAALFEKPVYLIMFDMIDELRNVVPFGIRAYSRIFSAPIVKRGDQVSLAPLSGEVRSHMRAFVSRFHSAKISETRTRDIFLAELETLDP